jgi:hypothetical protein
VLPISVKIWPHVVHRASACRRWRHGFESRWGCQLFLAMRFSLVEERCEVIRGLVRSNVLLHELWQKIKPSTGGIIILKLFLKFASQDKRGILSPARLFFQSEKQKVCPMRTGGI